MKGEPVERQAFQHLARFRFVRAVADIDADRLGRQKRFHHSPERRQHAIERIREN